jgi:hypothetical protein
MQLTGLGQDLTASGSATVGGSDTPVSTTPADPTLGAGASGAPPTTIAGGGPCGTNPCGFSDLFFPSAPCQAYLACGSTSAGVNLFCGVASGLGFNCTLLGVGLAVVAYLAIKESLK